jgi:rsbT co-antagonist protein RsbR
MVILRPGLQCGASVTCLANCEKKKTSTPAPRRTTLVSPYNVRTATRHSGGQMSDSPSDFGSTGSSGQTGTVSSEGLLPQLVQHLRRNRTVLREEWARRITEAELLTAMTPEELFSEATAVYDNYVEVLETGSVEALQAYARDLSERIIPRGVETDEVLGIVLLLRDVLARSLFEKYQTDFEMLNRVLDAYEPAANRIANTVGVSFVQERERIIRQQQEAIRELSTPVLQVREQLLILPIIGVLDSQRARQVTEQLLRAIRANRAKVVVIDITGVPTIDSTVANHLVQTVDASGLMGASVIITGLSSEIALTLVTIGLDLSKMNAVGDLQGGIEEAERLLGYEVTRTGEQTG